MRRLPVYLLIDTSASMQGEPINAVNKGVEMMIRALRKNPQAIESVYISVITFNTTAQVEIPLIDLGTFLPPHLEAKGQTALGEALTLVTDRINSEVTKTTFEQKGDWKPIVFIMTDGVPIDDWQKGLEYFKSTPIVYTIACAVGLQSDVNLLKRITPHVIQLKDTDENSISKFFLWMSASIDKTSVKIESEGDYEPLLSLDELPPPPPNINIL